MTASKIREIPVSQASTKLPSDQTHGSVLGDARTELRPSDTPGPLVATVSQGSPNADQLDRDLHDIALANRVLASRVAELDAELHRQVASVERLHTQVAVEMQRNVATESLAELRDELFALQSGQSFRWSST